MNREIKFRAWGDIYSEGGCVKDMIYNPSISGLGFTEFVKINDLDMNFILMQYTGLKDKNGKEIYEGDIIKNEDKYRPINSVIYYADIINEHDGDFDEWYCGYCLDDGDYTPLSNDVEIIGNIYENPELLK